MPRRRQCTCLGLSAQVAASKNRECTRPEGHQPPSWVKHPGLQAHTRCREEAEQAGKPTAGLRMEASTKQKHLASRSRSRSSRLACPESGVKKGKSKTVFRLWDSNFWQTQKKEVIAKAASQDSAKSLWWWCMRQARSTSLSIKPPLIGFMCCSRATSLVSVDFVLPGVPVLRLWTNRRSPCQRPDASGRLVTRCQIEPGTPRSVIAGSLTVPPLLITSSSRLRFLLFVPLEQLP